MKISRIRQSIFIGALVLFLFACSPASQVYISVENIEIANSIIYVRASQHCTFCDESKFVSSFVYYASRDNSQSWDEILSPNTETVRMFGGEQARQSSLCLSVDGETCYKITEEQVVISRDGGMTWKTDWQIPPGRKLFMTKKAFGLHPDTAPFDINAVTYGSEYYVVVAMGNQGILVKSPEGNWNRYAVGTALPIPYQAANFEEAIDVLKGSEIYLAVLLAFVCFILLSALSWLTIFYKSENKLSNRIIISVLPLLLLPVASVLACFLASNIVLAFGIVLLACVISWLVFMILIPRKVFGTLSLLSCLFFSFLFCASILMPFIFWALGTISIYETATGVSSIVGAVIFLVALFVEFRFSTLSVKPIEN